MSDKGAAMIAGAMIAGAVLIVGLAWLYLIETEQRQLAIEARTAEQKLAIEERKLEQECGGTLEAAQMRTNITAAAFRDLVTACYQAGGYENLKREARVHASLD